MWCLKAPLRRRRGARIGAKRVLLGTGFELLAAGIGAEVVGLALELRRRLGLRLFEVHSANRICCHAKKPKFRPGGCKQILNLRPLELDRGAPEGALGRLPGGTSSGMVRSAHRR